MSNLPTDSLRPCLPRNLDASAQALHATNYAPLPSAVTSNVMRTVRATRKDPNSQFGARAMSNALTGEVDPLRASIERMRLRFPHLTYRECRAAKLAQLASRPQGGLTYHTPSARKR